MPLASARSQITEAKMAKIEMTYLKENLQLDKQKFALLTGQWKMLFGQEKVEQFNLFKLVGSLLI